MITNIYLLILITLSAYFFTCLFTVLDGILAKKQLKKLQTNDILNFKLKKIQENTFDYYLNTIIANPVLFADYHTKKHMNCFVKNKNLINEKYDFIKKQKEAF